MTFRWNNLSGGDFIPCKTGHSQSWFEVTGRASNFIGFNIVELCVVIAYNNDTKLLARRVHYNSEDETTMESFGYPPSDAEAYPSLTISSLFICITDKVLLY